MTDRTKGINEERAGEINKERTEDRTTYRHIDRQIDGSMDRLIYIYIERDVEWTDGKIDR